MTMTWNRIASSALAGCYIIAAAWWSGAEGALKVALFSILPLGCIWFSDAMGGYVGSNWRENITETSPGLAVCIAGWLLLLLPAFFMIVSTLAR